VQMVTEFMRDIWSDSFDDFRRNQADGPLLWWFLDILTLTREHARREHDASAIASLTDTRVLSGMKSPNGRTDGEEIAIWRLVAAAYVLMIGTTRPPRDLKAECVRQTEAYFAANDVEWRWRAAERPIPASLYRGLLSRLEAFSTDDGIEFVREVCLDIAPGWRPTGLLEGTRYTFEPMKEVPVLTEAEIEDQCFWPVNTIAS
jgi:hypothetical protein